ncbi:Piwi-like protein 1 [Seminavis robusta]|uniref:Piwi-like protein 1 n=1 Tax=Seminavis robusta TaxID=568900 RepID=A0A9N8EK59_9STRA|nr:Piwi-like protein 1 [Seminavis robusta]|eukprot:Sro1389_g268570.1 Piwi-like protein 1 (1037) ;mRNA; f:18407-22269
MASELLTGSRAPDRRPLFNSMSGHGQRYSHYGGGGGGGGYRGGDGDRGHGGGGRDYHGGRGHDRRDSYGRGGGGRGGGGRDFRGGRGGRGGGRGHRGEEPEEPDLQDIKKVKTNKILGKLPSSFRFYYYTAAAMKNEKEQVDSRYRRRALFNKAIFDNLLADKSPKEKQRIRKSMFFEGSFFFSTVQVEGLEGHKLPLKLVTTDRGETFTVLKEQKFKCPKSMDKPKQPQALGANVLQFEHQCSNCGMKFSDTRSLLQHCQAQSHMPVYTNPDDPTLLEPDDKFFLQYCNVALARALQDKLTKWGTEFIDPTQYTEPTDWRGNSLGITIYRAYSCDFGLDRSKLRAPGQVSATHLTLTVDLRSKIMRSTSLLDEIYGNNVGRHLSDHEKDKLKRQWEGQVVIYKLEKKCYSIVALRFDLSPKTFPVKGLKSEQGDRDMLHSEYFEIRKNTSLQYPDVYPMVEVQGRRKESIYFPAELVCGNELSSSVREQLPQIASYLPKERNEAVDKMLQYLGDGQGGQLLSAYGITLQQEKDESDPANPKFKAKVIVAKAVVMSVPELVANGVRVPDFKLKGDTWGTLKRSTYRVDPNEMNIFNVVVVHHGHLSENAVMDVYGKVRDNVNSLNSCFQFQQRPADLVKFEGGHGELQNHCNAVQDYFGRSKLQNVFVLDLIKPASKYDPAYPVIKRVLGEHGYLSQCISFKTFDHERPPRNKEGRGRMILQGVARQVLQKCGARLWWVRLPPELPLPCVMVGVDVFHSPREYDAKAGRRVAKPSCAAIVVQVVRPGYEQSQKVEVYSEVFQREAGEEFGLQQHLCNTVRNALSLLDVSPLSCIVWRDGIADSSFGDDAMDEITGIRLGLNNGDLGGGDTTQSSMDVKPPAKSAIKADPVGKPQNETAIAERPKGKVPLAYIVCQKRIAIKLLTTDGQYAAPSGTLVDGIQGLTHDTFYIQGRAPKKYSTAKPTRFITVERDPALDSLNISKLTWEMCYDYPNWTGPVKVPGVTMEAHKLAMIAGVMSDSGTNLAHRRFTNRKWYL